MIISHGPNKTEIQFANSALFLSYSTPVAFYDYQLNKVFVTNKKYSSTTTRHINKWLKVLVTERGFPSKGESPQSYGTSTEETLQALWDIATRNNISKRICPEGDINWRTDPGERIQNVLDE